MTFNPFSPILCELLEPPGTIFSLLRMASKISSDDLAVQATNDDATACKRWGGEGEGLAGSNHVNADTHTDRFAVQKGYWRDEFIQHFCRSVEKKSPEISRGREKCAFVHMYTHTSPLPPPPPSPRLHMAYPHTHTFRLLCPCQKHTYDS